MLPTKHPMTLFGKKQLEQELNNLKNVVRPNIITAISEARAHGDLKENAEYHAAREQQSFNENRIAEIEAKLSNVQVVDITKLTNEGKVVFASTVSLIDCGSQEEVSYQIVGEDEADLKKNKISFSSPIARELIGKYEGDVVEVNAPAGLKKYEINSVEYIVYE